MKFGWCKGTNQNCGKRVLVQGYQKSKKPGSSFLEFLAQDKQTVQSTILKYCCHALSQAGDWLIDEGLSGVIVVS